MRYVLIVAVFLLSGLLTEGICREFAPATPSFAAPEADKPVFTDYRGVKLGMTNSEVRQILGRTRDQSDTEDMFEPENGETARIFYDEEMKVRAMTIMYSGDLSKAPTPKQIVGSDIPAREDGGMFKRVEYPDEGFWISYVRLAGDSPMVMITVQVL